MKIGIWLAFLLTMACCDCKSPVLTAPPPVAFNGPIYVLPVSANKCAPVWGMTCPPTSQETLDIERRLQAQLVSVFSSRGISAHAVANEDAVTDQQPYLLFSATVLEPHLTISNGVVTGASPSCHVAGVFMARANAPAATRSPEVSSETSFSGCFGNFAAQAIAKVK